MRRVARVVCCAVILASIVLQAQAAENWPQWRGPGGQGVSSESAVPTEWGPDRNLAWKTELPGTGHSSPIVWGDRIFVTAVLEGDNCVTKEKTSTIPNFSFIATGIEDGTYTLNQTDPSCEQWELEIEKIGG